MKLDKGIAKKYRQSIEAGFQTILEIGNEKHRRTANLILDSEMHIYVAPVSKVNASGITGVINPSETNEKIASERLSLRDALGEVFITIAEETLNSMRGCIGTFVHENQHALDFALVIESFSNADMNPLSVYNPTLYEMEWAAHIAAGEFMVRINEAEYLEEGLGLMILGHSEQEGYFVSEDGIRRRLKDNYGLDLGGNLGNTASDMAGLIPR